MCGTMGYDGSRLVTPVILEGRSCFEYRGYDSAGLNASDAQGLAIRRGPGKVSHRVSSTAIRSSLATSQRA